MSLTALHDSFDDPRGSRRHQAIDILAPRGTAVRAVDEGVVRKLYTGGAGGISIYHFDPTETFCYYYAHLDGYASGLREGARVAKGDLLGYVGTTGNAPPSTPHLHFSVFRLSASKNWWEGTPINPYALWARPAEATTPAE